MNPRLQNPALVLMASFAIAAMFTLTIGAPGALAQGILVGAFAGIMIASLSHEGNRIAGTIVSLAFPIAAMLIAAIWDDVVKDKSINPTFYLALGGFLVGLALAIPTCWRREPEKTTRTPTEIVAAVPTASTASTSSESTTEPTAPTVDLSEFESIIPQR